MQTETEWEAKNIKNEAEERGVSGHRIIFGTHLPPDKYLARYQVCDLFLDTMPYNAGATASDALWAELPVITLMGESFASRVAASLLEAIDLPELITVTQADYESLAIELARHPEKLAEIRKKLSGNRLNTSLFNSPLFTRNLEAAYLKMYAQLS